jgi:hemolysin activation/secretion protein
MFKLLNFLLKTHYLSLAPFVGGLIFFPSKVYATNKFQSSHSDFTVSETAKDLSQLYSAISLTSPLSSTTLATNNSVQLTLPKPDSVPVQLPKTPETSDLNPDLIKVDDFIFENERGESGPKSLKFSHEDLEEEIRKRVNIDFSKGVTFAQLLQIRSEITAFYIENGYITSGAYIPEGSLDKGKVRIRIIEGKLEEVDPKEADPNQKPNFYSYYEFSKNSKGYQRPKRLAQGERQYIKKCKDKDLYCIVEFVNGVGVEFENSNGYYLTEDIIRNRLVIKQPLQKDNLIDALSVLQTDSTIEKIDAELLPSEDIGRNILKIKITTKQSCNSSSCKVLQIYTDNSRSPSVGSNRRQIKLNFYPGNGVEMGLAYANTVGSHAIDLGFSLPIDKQKQNEWLKTVNIRYNNVWNRIIEDPFSRLDINSVSRYLDINLRQSRYLGVNNEIALSVSGTWQQSETSLLGIGLPLSQDADDQGEIRVLSFRGIAEWNRRWANSAIVLGGEIGFGNNISKKENPFLIFRGRGQWLKQLGEDTLFLARLNTQFSSQALPSLEQISFGGQDTLRGYRQNFLLADNGINASLEFQVPVFRYRLFGDSGVVQLVPFVDFATAWNYSKTDRSKIPSPLWTAGIGMQVRLSDQFKARLDWGFPLTSSNFRGTILPKQGVYFSVSGVLAF